VTTVVVIVIPAHHGYNPTFERQIDMTWRDAAHAFE
jgi:hypothetical protein